MNLIQFIDYHFTKKYSFLHFCVFGGESQGRSTMIRTGQYADYYRMRAAQERKQASRARSNIDRAVCLKLAEQYDLMAARPTIQDTEQI
ncbi:hypothetical protein SH584_02730 [Sphingomonas sp. LY29]|uniref:hypothetical protein n=2 Tax=unclassified Sphingomonas TaxID=196159 RepID=UPI002D77C4D0|nr:hypothetical protein [Sphingomonas sp. LY29]WRP26372.1 hypothetical protein SH584_02730 [Sphingomonas sp. LY29]